MIKFQEKVKILKVENKTLKTGSGNDFSFTELLCQDLDEKRPTRFITRLGSFVEPEQVKTGTTVDASFIITHNEGRDGRIWNNIILCGIKDVPKSIPAEVQNIGKEKAELQDFMDSLPF